MLRIGNKQLWRVLTVVTAFLLTISVAAMAIMTEYATMINGALNITNTRVVETDGGNQADTMRFQSEFNSMEEMYAHQAALARELEAEGAVLLKNDGAALPLAPGAKISLFSRSSVDVGYGGTGSGSVSDTVQVSMKDALEKDGRLSVNPALWSAYEAYTATLDGGRVVQADFTSPVSFYVREAPASIYTADVKSSYAAYGDAAVVVLTRSGGEGADLVPGDFGDGSVYLRLQSDEKAMLEEVRSNFDKIIVLVNSSNAMELDWLDEYGVDAALWIGGVGQEGLDAVADILVGRVNPSGRLVDTYAADSLSAPAMQNFGNFTFSNVGELDAALAGEYGENQASVYSKYLVYQEGIYVGYKYYETRYEDSILGGRNADSAKGAFASAGGWNYADEVTFPFGYGLSYTTFTQTLDSVEDNGGSFTVKVTVRNTGSTAGKDVVQVYGQSEYTDWDKANGIEKAAVQLVGFGKTGVLAPNGSETVTITVDKYDLAAYDYVVNKGYILEAGDYYLAIGSNAHDALNNILSAKGMTGMTDQDGSATGGDSACAYRWTEGSTDTQSFMYAEATQNRVTNLFDDADLNYYGDGLVRYTTRNDWNTFPEAVADLAANSKMIETLAFNYVESGSTDTSMFRRGQNNGLTLAALVGADYHSAEWETLLDQMTIEDLMCVVAQACKEPVASIGKPLNYLKDGPQAITGNASSGGGLYFPNPAGICMLTNESDKPTETPSMAYPSEVVIASTWNTELVEELGEAFGEDGLWTLVHHHYSPGANIHRTPYAGRNFEYYSEDGFLSGTMAGAEVKGERSKGMITYIKHFVANDQETNRTGVSTFCNEQALREIYLRGFEYSFTVGGSNAVMGSFNRIGCTWSGAHKGLMTGLLVDEWGFNGIVDTDFALFSHMEARSGVMAGTTDFAVTNDARSSELLKSLETDAELYAAVRESAHRNLYVIANSSEMNGLSSNMQIVTVLTWYQIAAIAAIAVFGVAAVCSAALLTVQTYGKKKEEK